MIYDYEVTTGNVVARFEPIADMAEVEACVKALL